MIRKALWAVVIGILALCASYPAFANSSWIWISRTRPFDVLPWAAVATVLCEWIPLVRFAGLRKRAKALGIVITANLISFAAPYAWLWYDGKISGFELSDHLNHLPAYTIGFVFAAVTIAFELPFVYGFLKRDCPDRKRLIWTTIISNIATTALVGAIERLLCRGHW